MVRPKRTRDFTRAGKRMKRAGKIMLATLGVAAVFATSLLAGVVLHIDMPVTRRVAAAALGRAVSGELRGSIGFGPIEYLGLRGATLSELTVKDEDGTTVVVLSDVRIRSEVTRLIRELLSNDEKLTVIVSRIRAERAEVQIEPDEHGVPTIARALTAIPRAPTRPSQPTQPSRPFRIWFPDVDVAHVYGRGHIAGLPVMEVTLGAVKGSVLATSKGVAVDVRRYGMTVRGLGGTDATGTGELFVRVPGAVWSSFDGYFGNLPLSASVHVKGSQVAATVDVPRALPDDVRVLLPEWPLQQAVSGHVEASGKLPVLQAQARFDVEQARITASGPIRFGKDFNVKLDVQGRGVDIRALWPKAPATKVDVDTALTLFDRKGRVVADVNGTTAPTKLLGQPVPAADVSGTFDDKGFAGKATLHENGMPVKLAIAVAPSGRIDIDARAPSFQIERAPRVAQLTRARGHAEARVKARIEKDRLDATLTADVRTFALGAVKLDRGHVSGTAKGPISDPEKIAIDAKIDGNHLEARGVSFDRVAATTVGPVVRPRVSAKLEDRYGPEISARATIEAKSKSLRDLDVEVKRESAALAGHIARLDLDAREVQIENLRLTGAGGELTGAVRVGRGKVEVKAKGDGLDLDRLARALGLPRGVLGGKLNIDADVVATSKESRGRVHVGLGNGSLLSVGGISLGLDATLDGEHVEGSGSAVVDGVGAFAATWNGDLPGHAADPESWKGITGQSEIQATDVDLAPLRHVLPRALRIERLAGKAFAVVRVERRAPKELPNVRVEIAGTRGLELTRGGETKSDPPLEIKGIEIETSGGFDGEKGDASGTTVLLDPFRRSLLSASGTTRVDWHKLLTEPDDWLSELSDAPVMFRVAVPERRFDEFPEPFRPRGIVGSAGGTLWMSGSANDPRFQGTLDVRQVKSATSRRAVAVDGRAEGEFELGSGRYRANVALRVPGQRVAQLTAHGVASVTEGTWTSEAQLALEGVPLGVVPALAEARVAGKLFGNVSLVRPKADAAPMLRARVTMQDVSVDLAKTGKGTVTVDSNGSQLHATAEFRGGAGTLTAEAHLPLDWTQLLPAVDRSRRVRLSVGSNGVDAVVLSPFLRDIFSRMSGRVSGNLEATLEPRKDAARKPVGDWEATVQGEAKVDDASLQIAPLGIEFHDMKLEAHVKPNGRLTEVHIEQATAKSRSEKPNVTVRDAVIFFDGLRVTRGHATLQMTGMPMMLEGVPQATATGSAQFQLERDKDGMVVKVDVPTLTARLPQASSRNVVDLGDNPAIEVVQALREPKGAQSTDRILPWRFDVNLRRGVRIRRSDLDIPLTGQLGIGLGEKTTVTGAVELEPGGRFQSWGKTWVIEAGRVAFASPDPSDPLLAATASWRAPEGTTVYVDVRGTLKHATLTLTSDPSRSEPEIMALLFGGSASGSSDESSTARTSESAYAGGLATAFNTIFADALVGGVELRTATDENKASYTAAVRLSENVWFEGTYRNRLEQQQSTTSTEPLDVSGTVDWRFRRNWSLRTEVGTLGTGLDLLWQYRY